MKVGRAAIFAAARAAATALALPFMGQPVFAQESDVRVVLPLQLDGASPEMEFERVDPDADKKTYDAAALCDLISAAAEKHGLPKPYFARLIWKESRFDISAVSPAGAQGIAQFIPATAMRRKLRDPFDPEQAIPASAAYLADLRDDFGNLGLAAAAYNSGENRVSRWLDKGGYLPFETEDYVLAILGKPVETFREATEDEEQQPLDAEKSFDEACRALPVKPVTATLYASTDIPPWGVQVAGNFNRTAAVKQWERVRVKLARIIGDVEPAIFATRGAIGRKQMHVVQIGASDKREANDLCNKLRLAGGSCVVVRN